MPTDLFRTIEARIARRELSEQDSGITIEFEPNLAPNLAEPRVITQRLTPDAPIDSAVDSSAAPRPEIGSVLRNRYVLESRLGRGGMGTVFKALDRYRGDLPQGNRHVAIKFLDEKMDGRAQTLSNLRREFYCAQALSHPNIVKMYELDLDDDAAFFTMEFLEGELLSSMIERLSPAMISRAFAWAIIREIGAALAHAHSRNVAHGDLKPQNIMITKSGEVRLLDFGASSALTRQLFGADTVHNINATALTPAYACCELLEGQQPDPRDDLYALACLSYELLAGKHPFERRRSTDARDRGMLARRPPGLTRRQWQTLVQGLAWNRQDRSMSVRDWIAGVTAVPVAHPSRRPLLPTTSRRAAVVATLAVLVIILGAGLWISFRGASLGHRSGSGDAAPAIAALTAAPHSALSAAPDSALPAASDSAPSAAPDSAPSDARDSAPSTARPAAPTPAPATAQQSAVKAVGSLPSTVEAVERRTRIAATPRAKNADLISISADGYKIPRGQKFAEIHVRRSAGAERGTSFAWWTEPSTAKPGVDYAAQSRITQLLPAGKRMASLFVRLIPNPARSHAAVFYVVIGEPGNGAALGRVTRAAVELPAK